MDELHLVHDLTHRSTELHRVGSSKRDALDREENAGRAGGGARVCGGDIARGIGDGVFDGYVWDSDS